MKVLRLAGLLIIAIAAIGCNNSGHFVYVIGPGTNSVIGLQQTPSGKLVQLTSISGTTDSVPLSIIVHPSGNFIYVANSAGNDVTLFTISGGGTLTVPKDPISNNPLGPYNAGTTPLVVAATPGGQFVYVLNGGSNGISGFSVNGSTGNLVVLNSGAQFPTPTGPVSMVISGNGKFLYVAHPALHAVSGFTIGSDGTLTAMAGSPFSAGTAPSWVTVDPGSKFLYVADATANQVLGFTLDGNSGVPSSMSGSPFGAGTQPTSLAIDSNDNLLIATNRSSNNISVYSINSSGALGQVSGSPFTTGVAPVFATVDSTNRFLLVGDSGSNDIAVFSLVNGTVTSISGSPFNIPTAPAWIASH